MHRVRTVLITCLIAAGVLAVAAPAASALPISERTIRSECRAVGGHYWSTFYPADSSGPALLESHCSYRDNEGNRYTDNYVNGEYEDTYPI
jgi:hypothetical protein